MSLIPQTGSFHHRAGVDFAYVLIARRPELASWPDHWLYPLVQDYGAGRTRALRDREAYSTGLYDQLRRIRAVHRALGAYL